MKHFFQVIGQNTDEPSPEGTINSNLKMQQMYGALLIKYSAFNGNVNQLAATIHLSQQDTSRTNI